MAASVSSLKDWLNTLEEDAEVAIDDGGLTIVVLEDPDNCFELGGIPSDDDIGDEEDCDCDERSWHGDDHDSACPLAGKKRQYE